MLLGIKHPHLKILRSRYINNFEFLQVTVGPSLEAGKNNAQDQSGLLDASKDVFIPPPRINCGLVAKKGILYMYGGMFEDGDRQLMLNDFYFLGNITRKHCFLIKLFS